MRPNGNDQGFLASYFEFVDSNFINEPRANVAKGHERVFLRTPLSNFPTICSRQRIANSIAGQTLPPDGSRTLLHNRITIGGQVQEDSLGDVCALIWCYPFIVQVRTTVALRIFNERTVDGTDNQVFNCGRHLTSQSLAHE